MGGCVGCGSAGEGGGGRMDERVAGSNHEHIIHDGRISLARIGLAPVPLPLWWRQTSEEFTLKTILLTLMIYFGVYAGSQQT